MSIAPLVAERGFPLTVLPRTADASVRARQIRRFADDHDVDVVHVYGPWLAPALAVALRTDARRVGVVTNWTMQSESYVPGWLPQILGTAALQRETAGLHPGPVWLMEPPIDLAADHPDPVRGKEFRAGLGIDEGDIVVGVVSRLDRLMKSEGILAAVRALRSVADNRLRLLIVGDGDARTEIEAEAAATNHALGRPAVVLTGALLDPRAAYDASDVVLGMGGSALRALAHARPLVVLGEEGFCRSFDPTSAHWFYDEGFYGHGDGTDAAPALTRILDGLTDPAARERLGEFGLAEVRARFSLGAATLRLEDMYRWTLAHPASLRDRWADTTARQLRTAMRTGLRTVRGGR